MLDLYKIKKEKDYIIDKLDVDDNIKRRFLDLGIIPGAKIKKVLTDYSQEMSAYYIMGSLIAIRNKDTKGIKVNYVI